VAAKQAQAQGLAAENAALAARERALSRAVDAGARDPQVQSAMSRGWGPAASGGSASGASAPWPASSGGSASSGGGGGSFSAGGGSFGGGPGTLAGFASGSFSAGEAVPILSGPGGAGSIVDALAAVRSAVLALPPAAHVPPGTLEAMRAAYCHIVKSGQQVGGGGAGGPGGRGPGLGQGQGQGAPPLLALPPSTMRCSTALVLAQALVLQHGARPGRCAPPTFPAPPHPPTPCSPGAQRAAIRPGARPGRARRCRGNAAVAGHDMAVSGRGCCGDLRPAGP
jgi:hypothetical protein